jgi:SAM-dependent methyltransferase
VLHVVEGNPQATMVADLADGASLPSDSFDCIICTQTLMFIYDVRAAISTLHRILKSGGVLLVTVAGVSHQISRYDAERWGDYWRFTSLSMRRLLEEVFPPASILVETYGNVMAAMALLQGLAVADLSGRELDEHDPDYEVTIGIKAVKP